MKNQINETQLNKFRSLIEKNKEYLSNIGTKSDEDKKSSIAVSMTLLMEYYSLNQHDAYECITDAGNDNKIDAIYFNDDDDEIGDLIIIQSKYKKKDGDTNTIGEDEIKICINNCKKILEGTSLHKPNDLLKSKLESFQELLRQNDYPKINIKIFFVTNGLIHDGFKDMPEVKNCDPNINIIFVDASNFGYSSPVEFGEIKVNLKGDNDQTNSIFSVSDKNYSGAVLSTSVKNLMGFYENSGERLLLNSNVRYLIKNSSINKEIRNSFINDPEKFCYLNNGITIISSNFEINPTGHDFSKVELTRPSVVNGGQTIATLYNLFSTDHEKYKSHFEKANILIRIYKAPDEYAIRIAQATNTQNPIRIVDLKANDQAQKTAKHYFERYGVGLITKLGEDISFYNDIVTNEHLLQVYASLYADEPSKAKTSKATTFKSFYGNVFNENIDESMCKKLMRCYHISKFLGDKSVDNPVVIKNSFYSLIYTMKKINSNIENQNIPNDIISKDFQSSFEEANEIISQIIQSKKDLLQDRFSMNNLFKSKEIKDLIDLKLTSQ